MVAKIVELRAQQQELVEQHTAVLAEATRAQRTLTDVERKRADDLEARTKALNASICSEEDRLVREKSGPGHRFPSEAPETREREPIGSPAAGRTYAEMFGEPRASEHFASSAEFLMAMHAATRTGAYHPGLYAAMGDAVPSQGGFAVPTQLAAEWLDRGLEDEIVRPRAMVYAMKADQLNIPGWEDADHATPGAGVAGFRGYWTAELASQITSDGTLRLVALAALKLLVATQLSNELLADGGQSFRDQLETKMGKAIGWYLDNGFITGTGVGQPLGLLNDPALITITKEASQPANTFMLENALKMYERLAPNSYDRAVWIVNHSVVPQLYQLNLKIKNVAGTENVGGSAVPYFTVAPNGALALLGIPIVRTEKVPALSSKGDVILADLSQYAVGLRADITVESSRHAGWSTDSTFYRAVLRVAGKGTWNKVMTPKNGSTRSWVVTLEAR